MMRGLIEYTTQNIKHRFLDFTFSITAIEDLDKAIDRLCEMIEKEGGTQDPLAPDLCPYFGFLWPASIGLCDFLSQRPQEILGKTILEIGCGLALPSLLCAHLKAKVCATDFHPDVELFLKHNMAQNKLHIDYQRYNWRSAGDNKGPGRYDWVLGSDILYEGKHPKEVAKALAAHVLPGGRITLTDPGRSYLQQFVSAMRELHFKEELIPCKAPGMDIYLLDFKSDC